MQNVQNETELSNVSSQYRVNWIRQMRILDINLVTSVLTDVVPMNDDGI